MKRRLLAAFVLLLATGLSPARAANPNVTDVFDLQQYAGKVVVVDFWASWCVPCRRSFPWLNRMQDEYGDDGLVVIGINVDAQRAEADAFLADTPATFAISYDPAGIAARHYDVIAMPSTYVFDRTGNLSARHLGFKLRDRDGYEQLLRQLLAKDPS